MKSMKTPLNRGVATSCDRMFPRVDIRVQSFYGQTLGAKAGFVNAIKGFLFCAFIQGG